MSHSGSKKLIHSIYVACTCGLAPALANESLDAIEVVAEDSITTGDVMHSEHTGSHRRIPQAELDRSDTNLADVIGFETGIQSHQLGGFGTLSNLTLRASTAAQTGVYLNGIKLNSASNPAVDLSTLDMLNLETVDVYRGSTPLQLGSGVIGGAVNLKTRSVRSNSGKTRIQLGAGSFGLLRTRLSHGSSMNRWQALGSVSHLESDNDFRFLSDNSTPFNLDDDRWETRHNSAVSRLSALGHLQYRYSEDHAMDVLFQGARRDLGIPEFRNAADNTANYTTTGIQLQVNQTLDGFRGWNTRHTLFVNSDNNTFDDPESQIGFGAQESSTDSTTYGLKTYWEKLGNQNTLGITAEVRRERYKSEDKLDTVGNANAWREALSSAAQYSWFSANDSHTLTPALRFEITRNNYTGEIIGRTGSDTKAVFSPNVGYRWQYSDSLAMSANAGYYYRQPSFYELFGNQGLVLANQLLESERGINLDAGIQWTPREGWMSVATLFGSKRSELIATVYDASGIGRNINTGKADIIGLELSNQWLLSRALTGRFNITVQDAVTVNVNPALDGRQIPGQAQASVYARLQYHISPWKIYSEWEGAWGRYYDQANILPAKDQWLQNFGIEWQRRSLGLSFVINNLGDQVVEDINGYPRPGRVATMSFTMDL